MHCRIIEKKKILFNDTLFYAMRSPYCEFKACDDIGIKRVKNKKKSWLQLKMLQTGLKGNANVE